MKLKIKVFARARDLAGGNHIEIELPEGATVSDLRTALGEQCPALRPLVPNLHVAIGSEFADNAARIPAGTEVACFPPVSGG